MKRRGSWFVMVTSLLLIAFLFYYFKDRYPDQNTIVASINDKVITLSQLKQFAQNNFGVYDEEKAMEVLELMINQEVLLIQAEKEFIVKNVLKPRFDKQMQYARERLMLELFFDIDADGKFTNTTAELREYYNSAPLFLLQAKSVPYSETNALDKASRFSRELNRIQDFALVHSIVFPDENLSRGGNIGIMNFDCLPLWLEELKDELSVAGSATHPIDGDFGYVVYFRASKPTFNEARDFINKEILQQKVNAHKESRYHEIVRNNKPNLMNIDRLLNQKTTHLSNEILVTNQLTNCNLSQNELLEKLTDLYNIHTLDTIKDYDSLREYIDLFIGQKVLLTLADKYDYFSNIRFTKLWERERLTLIENQNGETIDYMMSKFERENVNSNEFLAKTEQYFEQNQDTYRRSDFFKLQTIVTADRNSAARAYNEAVTTRDFDTAVLKYSNDQFRATTKGIGGYLNKDGLEKSYDILVKRKIGDIVPPIEIELGVWHTYKILDRIQGAVKPIDEVRPQVASKLMFEMMKEHIDEVIHKHRIRVRIYRDNLIPKEDNAPLHKLFRTHIRQMGQSQILPNE